MDRAYLNREQDQLKYKQLLGKHLDMCALVFDLIKKDTRVLVTVNEQLKAQYEIHRTVLECASEFESATTIDYNNMLSGTLVDYNRLQNMCNTLKREITEFMNARCTKF